MKFDSKGEWITYAQHDKEIEVESTWMNGARFYPESIDRWKGGPPLTDGERERVFIDVVNFVKRKNERPIVVINTDDPLKELWERLCSLNQPVIKRVEYTSDEEQYQSERETWLNVMRAGKGLSFNGVEVRNGEELDGELRKVRKIRAA
jgi:hypothetical protein